MIAFYFPSPTEPINFRCTDYPIKNTIVLTELGVSCVNLLNTVTLWPSEGPSPPSTRALEWRNERISPSNVATMFSQSYSTTRKR